MTKWINIFSKNISYNIKFSQWDVNQLPLDYRTNAMTTELHTPKIYNTMHIYRQIDDHLIRGVEIPMYTYNQTDDFIRNVEIQYFTDYKSIQPMG